jgi:hypothetical protein
LKDEILEIKAQGWALRSESWPSSDGLQWLNSSANRTPESTVANGGNADMDETALAVLALLACVAHRLECGDFVN